MQITFLADSLDDLELQLREFLGERACPPIVAPEPARPMPAWAPAGASWVPMPGAPILVGSDGLVIPVAWQGDEPLPGRVVVNHDPDAEAAGAALLESTRV
jgi:hypothetical protein